MVSLKETCTLSSWLQNKYPLTPLHMPALSPALIVPVYLPRLHFFHFASSSYLSSYLSLCLFPSQRSPAKGLCLFIIHGVVLMAQATMSDVNLCTSKARSGYTTSSRTATAQAAVLRYKTWLNQHVQSHLGHRVHAHSLLSFEPPQTNLPFYKKSILYAFMQPTTELDKNGIQRNCYTISHI